GEDCALLRTTFVAETREEARRSAEPAIDRLYGGYLGGIRARSIYAEPDEELPPRGPDEPWFDFLMERDHLPVGTPDSVGEALERLRDAVDLEHLLIFNGLPGIAAEDSQKSLRLFADQVMPKFAGDRWTVAR